MNPKIKDAALYPLAQKKIVITRPAGLASALSEKITALGGEAVEFPCIQTKARSDKELSAIVPLIDDYNWLVFTSVAGVETVFAALARLGYAGELFQGKSFAVIGSGTAHALRARGFEADLLPEKYNAGYLGRALAERMSEEKGSKALFLRASVGSEQLPLALAEKSLPFLDIAVYDTYYCGDNSPRIKALIEAYDFDLAVFTSASTVRGFAQALPGIDLRPIKALCIGEQTAAEAKKLFAAIYISSNATIDSLADKMAELAVIGEI